MQLVLCRYFYACVLLRSLRRAALRELRAAIGALELGLAFPFCESVALRKTHWLAGYVALQHFALGVLGHDNSSPRRTELTLT